MCCTAINHFLPSFPKYGPTLESLLLCEHPKKTCWMRSCVNCCDIKVQEKITEIVARSGKDLNSTLKWAQWKKENNRFQKIPETGTFIDLRNHFMGILPEFLKHSYTKRCQAASFQEDCEEVRNSNGDVALVQIDFAEGFNCEAQEEIQAAHWNQATV